MDDNGRDDVGDEAPGLPPLDGDPYRVPTNAFEVTLVFDGGIREEVTVFLAPLSGRHAGEETVDEFLGSGRTFLPVRRAGGASCLVSRDALLCVEVGPEVPTALGREETAAGALELVRLELEGGVELEGTLRLLGPAQSRRVSDAFNGTEQFVPLERGERTVYVNKRRVVRVQM